MRAWNSVVRSWVLLAGLALPLALAIGLAAAKDEKGPPGKTIALKALVMAYEQADLRARIEGYVKTWKVDIGDRVKKGELLAELYVPEREAKVLQTMAVVAQDEAGVQQAKQAVLVAEAAVRKAQINVEKAKAALLRTKANVERWKPEYARAVKLMKEGTFDQATADQVLCALKAAEADAQEAEATLEAAKAGYAEVVAKRGKAEADVTRAEADLKVAHAAMESSKTMLEFAQIRAPFDGVVISRNVNEGDLVGADGNKARPWFTVARTDLVRVVLAVPEADAVRVVRGVRALVQIPARDDKKIPATVTRTSWSIDPESKTMRAEIQLDNAENKLMPGMRANVELLLQPEEPKK